MYCAIIHDSSHVTLALFSDVIFFFLFVCVYAVFLCRFYIHASEFLHFLCVSGAVVVKGRVVLQ